MANDSQRDKARSIFGKTFFENSKALPNPKNAAAALQKRANDRPIPTYKVGGAVKKNMPPQPTAAEREADRKRREEYAKMKPTKEQAAAITRGNRAADIEGGRYKDGGKAKKDGLAVMIAIGEPKKPMKKAKGGMACAKDGGEMMKPVKRAAGGAAKVRKGMMTPEGKITHAMNKMRDK